MAIWTITREGCGETNMSLTAKIQKEIKTWEDKIAARQLQVDRLKLKIKELRHLLDMAKAVEEK